MATTTLKRKRDDVHTGTILKKKIAITTSTPKAKAFQTSSQPEPKPQLETQTEPLLYAPKPSELVDASRQEDVSIQIVAGSYDRILHGVSATISRPCLDQSNPPETHESAAQNSTTTSKNVTFSDTFLFAAHTSSIRCLALSPQTESDSRILATGGSDERINLFTLSTAPPNANFSKPLLSAFTTATAENSQNKSLGNLIHHDRPITRLHFPTKSKLFSAAEDNTVAISRSRDWTVLSSIKAPVPKPHGRPSGDTAGPGEVPAGVNDFAIHPSQKLMLSVGRGEKCMRLWNLMTGKKAGVLSFERKLLGQVGEGKYGSGEGRKVLWSEDGEMFVVGFERGAAVFGIDSKATAAIRPMPGTKMHQMRFLPREYVGPGRDVLAVSTEDGRIMFFDVHAVEDENEAEKLPLCPCMAQLGGPAAGITNRVKDFEILRIPRSPSSDEEPPLVIVTGSSDGAVRVWTVFPKELVVSPAQEAEEDGNGGTTATKQVGNLVGELETGNRITCLAACLLNGKATGDDVNGAGECEAVLGEEDEDSEDDMSE